MDINYKTKAASDSDKKKKENSVKKFYLVQVRVLAQSRKIFRVLKGSKIYEIYSLKMKGNDRRL